MVQEIRRLENAIHATEVPTMIAKDCLANRQRRIDTDLVQDNTEKKLLQELEIISGIKSTLTEALNNARCGIFGFCLLLFPQNKRKIYKLRQLSLSLFVYFFWEVCDIIVNFIIQKLKSKHTSLKKYTNWEQLSCLSL